MNRLPVLLFVLFGLLVIAGCDSEGESLCVPGESKACTGPGACSGYQVCADAADRFLECQCGLADVIEDVPVVDVLADVEAEIRTSDEGQDTAAVEDVCGEEQEQPCDGNVCKWGMSLACPEVEYPEKPTEAEVLELLSCSTSSEVCSRCGVAGQLPCGNAADGGVYCRSNSAQWYSPDLVRLARDRASFFTCVACGSAEQPCCLTAQYASLYGEGYDQDRLPEAVCQDGLTCETEGITSGKCVETPDA